MSLAEKEPSMEFILEYPLKKIKTTAFTQTHLPIHMDFHNLFPAINNHKTVQEDERSAVCGHQQRLIQ